MCERENKKARTEIDDLLHRYMYIGGKDERERERKRGTWGAEINRGMKMDR